MRFSKLSQSIPTEMLYVFTKYKVFIWPLVVLYALCTKMSYQIFTEQNLPNFEVAS